jgi:hypothetical protein
MAITEAALAYIKALQKQKDLITTLSNSPGNPVIPGLNVKAIALKLAELDTNLQETIKYYKDLADREAAKEEQQQADAGVVETDEQKRARRQKKRDEALKKGQDIVDKYVEAQRDFIQEQIAIIEVNAGVIEGAVIGLPPAVSAAIVTASVPTAVGAAVPNYLYNIGVLLQTLRGFSQTLKLIKTAFLNILIAADKIKFVLPTTITGLLDKILNVEKLFEKEPTQESITPPAPPGTPATLKTGEYRNTVRAGYVIVTADNIQGAPKNSTGKILEFTKDPNGAVTGIKIEIVPPLPGVI